MSGPTSPGSPPELPPEVPEEYAATYRAAYEAAFEQALEAQPDRPPHRASPEEAADTWTWFERVRDSRWFVPLLLALLALLLVLGAYAVARLFAGRVSEDAGPAARPDARSAVAWVPSSPAPW